MRTSALLVAPATVFLLALVAGACGTDAVGEAGLLDLDAEVPDAAPPERDAGVDTAAPPPEDASVDAPGEGAATKYYVGGTIAGLETGEQVVLSNDGGPGYAFGANGSFTMPDGLASGASYAISVVTPPPGKKCPVTNGKGTIAGANVTGVGVSCVISCGDGVIDPGEGCDDANLNDADACDKSCKKNPIHLGGNSSTYIDNGLALVGETFVTASGGGSFGAAPASGILISSNDGGDAPFPTNWQTFLDAGGHILVFGGSSSPEYRAFLGAFLSVDDTTAFHTSDDCTGDWARTAIHPVTSMLPATYEFANPFSSYHMLHFTASQPAGTTLLGNTCHATGDVGVAAIRTYPSGGTFTYFAFDLGTYTGANTPADFVQPLLDGYLKYVRSKR